MGGKLSIWVALMFCIQFDSHLTRFNLNLCSDLTGVIFIIAFTRIL
jgi:hypothetical protein